MTFAITIGTFQLLHFARLNLAYARKVFGDSPMCVYDGRSENSDAMAKLAGEYGALYLGERENRGHFAGCVQCAVASIAFAQANDCNIAIKLNQRTVLLLPEIPKMLTAEFKDPAVTLVSPGRYPADSILDEASKFHARFPATCDVLAFRAEDWDAQGVADRYKQQWTTSPSRYGVYSEVFWANESKRIGPSQHRTPGWLTAHTPGKPHLYLRKIQNTEDDYKAAARAVGVNAEVFPVKEWQALSKEYRPAPRA